MIASADFAHQLRRRGELPITRTAVSLLALVIAIAALPADAQAGPAAPKPAPAQAGAFVAEAEATAERASVDASRVAWVNATYLTDDTDALAAQSNAEQIELGVKYALGAARFAGVA